MTRVSVLAKRLREADIPVISESPWTEGWDGEVRISARLSIQVGRHVYVLCDESGSGARWSVTEVCETSVMSEIVRAAKKRIEERDNVRIERVR